MSCILLDTSFTYVNFNSVQGKEMINTFCQEIFLLGDQMNNSLFCIAQPYLDQSFVLNKH